jgi:hypothetical protein
MVCFMAFVFVWFAFGLFVTKGGVKCVQLFFVRPFWAWWSIPATTTDTDVADLRRKDSYHDVTT